MHVVCLSFITSTNAYFILKVHSGFFFPSSKLLTARSRCFALGPHRSTTCDGSPKQPLGEQQPALRQQSNFLLVMFVIRRRRNDLQWHHSFPHFPQCVVVAHGVVLSQHCSSSASQFDVKYVLYWNLAVSPVTKLCPALQNLPRKTSSSLIFSPKPFEKLLSVYSLDLSWTVGVSGNTATPLFLVHWDPGLKASEK